MCQILGLSCKPLRSGPNWVCFPLERLGHCATKTRTRPRRLPPYFWKFVRSHPSEHHTTRPKTLPGPKHFDRSRSPPMGKPPGPASGSTGSKSCGSGKRPVFRSHGKQRCLGTAAGVEQLQPTGLMKSKGAKCPLSNGDGLSEVPTLSPGATQLGSTTSLPGSGRDHKAINAGVEVPGSASQASILDSLEDPMEPAPHDASGHHESGHGAAMNEVSPTIPFHAEDPVVPGAMRDRQTLALSLGYPCKKDLRFPQQVEESNWNYFPTDGRTLGQWRLVHAAELRCTRSTEWPFWEENPPGTSRPWSLIARWSSRLYSGWTQLPISTGKGPTCPDCSGRMGIQGASCLPPLFSGFSFAGSGLWLPQMWTKSTIL